MHPGEQSNTGFDPMWQTERRDVPRLLTLHLLCVCYFSRYMPGVLNRNTKTFHIFLHQSLLLMWRQYRETKSNT